MNLMKVWKQIVRMLVLTEYPQNLDAIPCRHLRETQITQEFEDRMARLFIRRRIRYSTYL